MTPEGAPAKIAAAHPAAAPGVAVIAAVGASPGGSQMVRWAVSFETRMRFVAVRRAVIIFPVSITAFFVVFALVVTDVVAILPVNAGGTVAVIIAVAPRVTRMIGAPAATAVIPAIIDRIIQVFVSGPHRFIGITFGVSDFTLGRGFTLFYFGLSSGHFKPVKLELILPVGLNARAVSRLIVRHLFGFHQNRRMRGGGVVGKMLNAVFIRPLVDVRLHRSCNENAGYNNYPNYYTIHDIPPARYQLSRQPIYLRQWLPCRFAVALNLAQARHRRQVYLCHILQFDRFISIM